jgi:hypothetical protein
MKYCITLWEGCILGAQTRYLKFDNRSKKFYFSRNKTANSQFQLLFSDIEVDAFPQEIVGAIQCGFLHKQEVENE